MNYIKRYVLVILIILPAVLKAQLTWTLTIDGGIQWNVPGNAVHSDQMEMSGKYISAIVTYGTDSNRNFLLKRKLVFPMLRTIPNDTRGSLTKLYTDNIIDSVQVNQRYLHEIPVSFYIRGFLQSESKTSEGVRIIRKIFPSTDKTAYIEKYTLVNNNNTASVTIHIPAQDKSYITDSSRGVYGAYVLNYKVYNSGSVVLRPGEAYTFSVVISGRKTKEDPYFYSADYEWDKRKSFIDNVQRSLILRTPNDTLNRMFAFAKIRVLESIFDTKEGLMHAPGGGDYYAAIWANDQAEYVNPFFPFTGNAEGIESARNSFRLFSKYINNDFKPIPSSIIAEGTDIWNGAGDRGDQAMISYGASLFALYNANKIEARHLWTLIVWCNEYLKKKKTGKGVIASDSDELEGRFKAGSINLSTNVLAYGAFTYSSRLAKAIGLNDESVKWQQEAVQLKKDIEKYFGANVEGFDTYRYYDGNDLLRSWICLPLVMGVFDRKEQTIQALLSPKLWTKNGILTESGSKTFWDRSTLYAFRGMFNAGATDTAMSYFRYYSATRLLGRHVPYAIEAWPEGDQRHLAGESGLYCRIVTEGLFGFDPISFNEFTICPRMPKEWNEMSLNNISVFNKNFDVIVKRVQGRLSVRVMSGGKIIKTLDWNGVDSIRVVL